MLVIPTTLSGIFLFLVVLIPGFIYVSVREGHRPIRKLSAFRETAAVVSASAASYVPVVVVFAVLALTVPSFNGEVGQALADPEKYYVAHAYRSIGGLLAFVATGSVVAFLRGRHRAFSRKADAGASAWWQVFSSDNGNEPHAVRRVSVYLKDGSMLVGNLKSFNNEAEEHADRDLILQTPLSFQNAGSDNLYALEGTAVVVSAREIQFFELFLDPVTDGPPAEPEEDLGSRQGSSQ